MEYIFIENPFGVMNANIILGQLATGHAKWRAFAGRHFFM